jgi:hypothetical protein
LLECPFARRGGPAFGRRGLNLGLKARLGIGQAPLELGDTIRGVAEIGQRRGELSFDGLPAFFGGHGLGPVGGRRHLPRHALAPALAGGRLAAPLGDQVLDDAGRPLWPIRS